MRLKNPETRICEYKPCSKPYKIKVNVQRFCSHECARANWKAEHPVHSCQKQKCLWCQVIFVPDRYYPMQKYCCHECGANFRNAMKAIDSKFFFNNPKIHEEFERLEREGSSYQLESD